MDSMQTHLYQLGNDCLLLNGDCTDEQQMQYLKQVAADNGFGSVELCLTDPPYAVNLFDTHDPTKHLFREHPIQNDNLSSEALIGYLSQAFLQLRKFAVRRYFTFYPALRTWEFISVFKMLDIPIRCYLLWLKQKSVISWGEFSYKTEGIIYAGTTDLIHKNKNRGQNNVFYSQSPNQCRTSTVWYHPSSKPVQILRDLLDAATIVGDTIIDPFAGTGSSLVACHRTGRKWLGIEIETRYCLATCLRFRYETANKRPVYEINLSGKRIQLDDETLKARFDAACLAHAKAQRKTTAKGRNHA